MMRPFYLWLQQRLNVHGARLIEDGDWGRNSIAALRDFQRQRGLDPTGVAKKATIQALRLGPEDGGSARPSIEPSSGMPPWMYEMHRRSGLHEVRDNGTLAAWMRRYGKYLGNPANLPWCGDAVESCLAKVLPDEPLPGNPFWAQAWRTFGLDAGGPMIGSIGVIRWNERSGHVGFVAGVSGSRINLLGGNQSNAINIRAFPAAKFIAFRWPRSFPKAIYPPLQGDAPSSSLAATR